MNINEKIFFLGFSVIGLTPTKNVKATHGFLHLIVDEASDKRLEMFYSIYKEFDFYINGKVILRTSLNKSNDLYNFFLYL